MFGATHGNFHIAVTIWILQQAISILRGTLWMVKTLALMLSEVFAMGSRPLTAGPYQYGAQ